MAHHGSKMMDSIAFSSGSKQMNICCRLLWIYTTNIVYIFPNWYDRLPAKSLIYSKQHWKYYNKFIVASEACKAEQRRETPIAYKLNATGVNYEKPPL